MSRTLKCLQFALLSNLNFTYVVENIHSIHLFLCYDQVLMIKVNKQNLATHILLTCNNSKQTIYQNWIKKMFKIMFL